MKKIHIFIIGLVITLAVVGFIIFKPDPQTRLVRILLRIGGSGVERADQESMYAHLVRDGKFITGEIELIGGPAHKCAQTSKAFVLANPDHRLFVGYALTEGHNIWVYHVWVMGHGRIHEMTDILRMYYFGIEIEAGRIR